MQQVVQKAHMLAGIASVQNDISSCRPSTHDTKRPSSMQVIKASNRPISQFEQFTCKVPDGDANGIKKSRVKPLSQHVVDAFGYAKDGLALYMHNLALIEVRSLQSVPDLD